MKIKILLFFVLLILINQSYANCSYHLKKLLNAQSEYILDFRKSTPNGLEQNYVNSYFFYVAEIYEKFLHMEEAEVKKFMEISRAVLDRTIIIVKEKHNKFSAGVNIVYSNSIEERLPLEISTGINLPRNERPLVEITRLTSSDSKTTKELLAIIGRIFESEEKLLTIYVYTSKIHARLYRRLGITHIVKAISDRDVLISFNSEEAIDILRKLKE